jgi:hypothetical protein
MERKRRRAFTRPSETQLDTRARDLDTWFEEKKRGRGSRAIMC